MVHQRCSQLAHCGLGLPHPRARFHHHRGVKQGCPLSPLLFILCYDVLNFKLAPLDNIGVKAAADDLAIEARSISDAISAFPIIDGFTVASGLGINRNKTVILSAKDCTHKSFAPNIRLIQSSSWPLVKIVNSVLGHFIWQEGPG